MSREASEMTLECKQTEIAREGAKSYPWRFPEQLSETLRGNGVPMKSVTLLGKTHDPSNPPITAGTSLGQSTEWKNQFQA